MTKTAKILLSIVALLFLLFLAVIIILPFVVDLNDYKDKISSIVKEQTGREFVIKGDIELSLFPSIGAKIGAMELKNAKGFGKEPFAAIESIHVAVKLMPLLSKKVEVDTISLKGLNLNLIKNSRGKTNWEDLIPEEKEVKKGAKETKKTQGKEVSPLAAFSVRGINISDSNLSWKDETAGKAYSVKNINLKTGQFVPNKPVDINLKFSLLSTNPKYNNNISLSTKLSFDDTFKKYELNKIELISDMTGDGIPGDHLKVKLRLNVAADLASQILKVSDLNLNVHESTLKGTLSVSNFSKPAIKYDFNLDKIDIDRYLPPQEKKEAGKKAIATKKETAKTELPLKAIRDLDINGNFRIGKLKVANLKVSNIVVTLKAKDGLITLHPLEAHLYGGEYKGNIKFDVRQRTPKTSLDENLSGVNIGPLLKDLQGKDLIDGTANLKIKLNAKGTTPEEAKKTLNGKVDFLFTNGAVKGFDMAGMIRKAWGTLKGQSVSEEKGLQQTDFSEIKGTATIVNGLVTNNDLLAKSPLLRITGEGNADLVKEKIDYLVEAKIVATLEGQGGKGIEELTGLTVPVRVSNTFADPKFKIDLQALFKSKAKGDIKKKAKGFLEKSLGGKIPGFDSSEKDKTSGEKSGAGSITDKLKKSPFGGFFK